MEEGRLVLLCLFLLTSKIGNNPKKEGEREEKEKMEVDASVQPTTGSWPKVSISFFSEEELTLESLTKFLERIKSKRKPQEVLDLLTKEELTTREAILRVTDQQFQGMGISIVIQNALKDWAKPTGIA